MPLNAVTLANAMTPGIKSAFLSIGALNVPDLDTLASNIATAVSAAVVSHITANAAVVTTCPSGAGTGVVT